MLARSELVHGTLVRRYKRFLADVILDDGEALTVHCPNTGSMRNCVEEGAEVWLSHSDNPKRKYAYTWELTRTSRGHTIGINTGNANSLVADAITQGRVSSLSADAGLRREVTVGDSRVDIVLGEGIEQCFVEVKGVTRLEDPPSKSIGVFPDAVSERATKHVAELVRLVGEGYRAVLFFCVQHSGIREVRPGFHIDPVYAEALREAAGQGEEVLAMKTQFGPGKPVLQRELPVVLEPLT